MAKLSRRGAVAAAASGAAVSGNYKGELGKAFSTTATQSTIVVTLTAGGHTGGLVIARVVGDGGVNLSSVSDSRGNTWTVDKVGTAGPKCNIASTGQNAALLQSGDQVTFTFSGTCNQRAAIIDEFVGYQTGSGRVDQSSTGTASTTARSGGTTGTTTQANELVIGCFALGASESSFTPGTGYSDFTTKFLVATGTTVEGCWKEVTATGTQNPTGTGGTSTSSNGVAVTYKA